MTTDFHSPALSWQEPRRRSTGGGLYSFLDMFWAWYDGQAARRQLASLNDHMLADIGIAREDLRSQDSGAYRPF